MSLNLRAHLGDLALTLGNLQQQFRKAARFEVGRAVAEAFGQFAANAICGPVAIPNRSVSEWDDDPWERQSGSWNDTDIANPDDGREPCSSSGSARFRAAITLGIGGARWTYLRTRRLALAIAAGLLLLLLGLAGGQSGNAVIDAWSSATALLRDDDLALRN